MVRGPSSESGDLRKDLLVPRPSGQTFVSILIVE
jgi:hypothetical protein